MRLIPVNTMKISRDNLTEFGGYNHNLTLQDNQFYDMQNMTTSFYPVLSPRGKRGKIRKIQKPNGLFAKNGLLWVDGEQLYYNGDLVGQVTDTKKQFVSMGAYVLIFPDKKYFNTDNGEFLDMGAKFQTVGPTTFHLCKMEGEEYTDYVVSATAPEEPVANQLWLDTSQKPNVLKQYSETTSSWVAIATTYVKLGATGIGAAFKQYDCVTISGCTQEQFNADMVIWARGDDYIVVAALIDEIFTDENTITLERRVPDMEYMTESQNRVWGCSSEKHEIYACKQGDPTNWFCYMGLDTDSYAVTVGTDGNFTGACTHLGYVLFFKDGSIHKIYGSKPSNYQLTVVNCRGVQEGSNESLKVVNETLLYKTRDNICIYDGSLPISVSNDLGRTFYKDAIAGALEGKYYISMADAAGTYHLFAYDTISNFWVKEDNTQAKAFAYWGGELYYIDQDNYLMCMNGSSGTPEENVEWYAITGDLGMAHPDKKYISKIQFRMTIEEKTEIRIYVQYDYSGEWEKQMIYHATRKVTLTLPIIPRRCDTMKIMIAGTGDAKIYNMAKVTEMGSEA